MCVCGKEGVPSLYGFAGKSSFLQESVYSVCMCVCVCVFVCVLLLLSMETGNLP